MPQPRTADQDIVRRINRSLVLNTIRLNAPISRAAVANLTGLNRSTVSNIVSVLLQEGLVWERETSSNSIGRPSIALTLRPDGGAMVGVEIGVDFVSILMTDFVAQPIWQETIDIEPNAPQANILVRAEEAIDQALARATGQGLQVIGIGVGLPGLVNVARGELIVAPNLGWRDLPLRSMWSERFHLPIYIENEANLSALGEYYFGAAHKIENFIYLSSGIGLGGGIVIDGKLFRGGRGYAGEIGHIQRDPNGELCSCGRRGCWETQVGPRAVLRRLRKTVLTAPDAYRAGNTAVSLNDLTFQAVVEAAGRGDPLCLQAIEEVARHLASGIVDLVNIFNPDMVIIGGALSLAREWMKPVIEDTLQAQASFPAANRPRLAFSDRGKDACVYGAIAVVLDDVLREMAIVSSQ